MRFLLGGEAGSSAAVPKTSAHALASDLEAVMVKPRTHAAREFVEKWEREAAEDDRRLGLARKIARSR